MRAILHSRLASVTTLIASLFITVTSTQAAPPTPDAPTQNKTAPMALVPSSPNIDAKAYVLMDADSGKILTSKNPDAAMPPASLTKLMTSYVISQAIKQGQIHLDDPVRISKTAWQRGGSRMFVEVGTQVPVKDLIHGIIVASGNDACVAMAEYIAGSEKGFAELMNQTAQQLGMTHTHFVDATGLPDPKHHSTAHDLAILSQALINDFPEDYAWYKQKWITYNDIKQPNRNRLLWRDPSVDGLKTGHTKAAGYCLISSAKRNDMRLISVVMGAPSDAERSDDSQALLNWGFRFYETHTLYNAHSPVTSSRVWLGQKKMINFGIDHTLAVTIPKGTYSNLSVNVDLPTSLKAPIIAGHAYGTIEVTLDGKTIASSPLLAESNDPEAGFWSRMTDQIAMTWHGWFS